MRSAIKAVFKHPHAQLRALKPVRGEFSWGIALGALVAWSVLAALHYLDLQHLATRYLSTSVLARGVRSLGWLAHLSHVALLGSVALFCAALLLVPVVVKHHVANPLREPQPRAGARRMAYAGAPLNVPIRTDSSIRPVSARARTRPIGSLDRGTRTQLHLTPTPPARPARGAPQ